MRLPCEKHVSAAFITSRGFQKLILRVYKGPRRHFAFVCSFLFFCLPPSKIAAKGCSLGALERSREKNGSRYNMTSLEVFTLPVIAVLCTCCLTLQV